MSVSPSLSKPANTAVLGTIVGMSLILIVFSILSFYAKKRRKSLLLENDRKYQKNQELFDI